MLARVRAHDLDIEQVYAGMSGDVPPRVARQRNRVDAVGNDGTTDPEIVQGDRIGRTVTGVLDRAVADRRLADRLFDRIDPQIHGIDLRRQRAGDRRLAGSRPAAEHDQHAFLDDGCRLSAIEAKDLGFDRELDKTGRGAEEAT